MADLEVALATVRDRIARYQRQGIGEQDTKAALIVPVLRALGSDTEDLEDVKLVLRSASRRRSRPGGGQFAGRVGGLRRRQIHLLM